MIINSYKVTKITSSLSRRLLVTILVTSNLYLYIMIRTGYREDNQNTHKESLDWIQTTSRAFLMPRNVRQKSTPITLTIRAELSGRLEVIIIFQFALQNFMSCCDRVGFSDQGYQIKRPGVCRSGWARSFKATANYLASCFPSAG